MHGLRQRRRRRRVRRSARASVPARVMRVLLVFRGVFPGLRIDEFRAVVQLVRAELAAEGPTELGTEAPSAGTVAGHKDDPLHLGLTTSVQSLPPSAQFRTPGDSLHGDVFYFCELRSEREARLVAQRAFLLKAVYEVIGHGNSYESACDAAVRTVSSDSARQAASWSDGMQELMKGASFRIDVQAFGRSVKQEQKAGLMARFAPVLLQFPGKVNLKSPQHRLMILEDAFPVAGHQQHSQLALNGEHLSVPEPDIRQVFLARLIGETQGGILSKKFRLPDRQYVGTTSMDAELAFIMANVALVRPGRSLILDPFCGTGSILISAVASGAHCIGADIDPRVLRGYGYNQPEPQSHTSSGILSNFEQYGLERPAGILRGDLVHSYWQSPCGGWLDAIITDPPYGIRESIRTVDVEKTNDLQCKHVQHRRLRASDTLRVLIEFAADSLVDNGRLVFWLACTADFVPEELPQHTAFRMVSYGEQQLTMRMHRRLVVMERLPRARLRAESSGPQDTRVQGAQVPDSGSFSNLSAKILRQPWRCETRLVP
ncbi:tRNA (guanine(10)-N2)-methyltransferase-like [Porphyridium purpureum]|uniref:tRNA (Guanine(10)-N2)-methyltransferase-like n=1 Tax=Porphyridium purpureum TaxID=35688 RepID=A0A5J4YQ33_PORPP|nr:tRNA (guanine(10)-N2)-methyltransferase-like [Porphyridium purpureum]|eukprot:POR6923..scf296_7